MNKKLIYFALIITTKIFFANQQQIKYFGELSENEICEYSEKVNGTCQLITKCLHEFKTYQKNETVLKICNFGKLSQSDLICCPKREDYGNITVESQIENRIIIINAPIKTPDLLDFKTCRSEFLKYRYNSINPNHLGKRMVAKSVPITKKNCDELDRRNKLKGKNFWDLTTCHCVTYEPGAVCYAPLYGRLVERGDRPNMVAIGWTRYDNKIVYKCGGSIITERFIVTAAHCKYFDGIEADTVRLGDRYLVTKEDDDIAQQHEIETFILHPDYHSRYHYNDIAMIKTVTKISFDKFVVPSCIDDLDSEQIGYFTDWTVAGYGETEDRIPSNVLLELKVDLASYEECNETYKYDLTLPQGIHKSQFCVKSKKIFGDTNIPDTCFGDSGSPLQFKTAHEIFADDFNTTYLSTVYQVSTVLGVVSFGLDCGFDVPSVYTRLAYFKNWMRAVIKYY